MSPASIQPLIDALSSHDEQVYALAGGALGCIGADAKAAMPVLEDRLKDKNPTIRAGVAEAIGKLGGNPDMFVPVLARSFREGDWETRSYVLTVLLEFKAHAKIAVPSLIEGLNATTNLTDTTNRYLHEAITAALKEIDPDAAAKVGVK